MKAFAATLAVFCLAGCNGSPDTEAQLLARQQAVDEPQLWRLQDVDGAGRALRATYACADTPMRKTFGRTVAEVGGTSCRDLSAPVLRPGLVTERCEAEGRDYVFTSQTAGDPTRDFRLTVTVTPLGGEAGQGREARHYLRLGACPAGWRVGDQADAARAP